ncbi:MAG: type I secretion system permease/ATPase [Betaproteobacteria bacterium]|nr:type I secretion system permease/ATPase [Betaproteobacteria bacterium]MCL2887088.1 type I secretion system permease/ATPase [Betaproteobacteria bacterium]
MTEILTDPAPSFASVSSEPAPSDPAASRNETPQAAAPPLAAWGEALLLAARRLGLSASPERLRQAATWTEGPADERNIIDLAAEAGLDAHFITLAPDELLSAMLLPALIALDGQRVGVITALDGRTGTFAVPVDETVVERAVAREEFSPLAVRCLLVNERAPMRDGRIDAYRSDERPGWLRNIFFGHWKTLAELGLGSLFANLLAVSVSLFAMQLWDRVVPARSIHTLWVLASGVALALVFEFTIRMARVTLVDRFGKQADLKLSAMFFSHLLAVRNDARPRSPGTLIAQLRDLEQLRELLTSSTLGVLIDLPFVVAFLFIIWVLGGPLVLVPLAAIPLLILPGLIAQIPLARLSGQGLAEAALRNAVLMESVYRVEDIKLMQAETRFLRAWNHANQVNGEIGLKQRFFAGLLAGAAQSVQQLAYVGVLVVGVYGIFAGDLSFGAVLACSILTSRTIAPLSQMALILGRVQNARVGKKALDNLLELPVDGDQTKDAYHKPAIAGRYSFDKVQYSYERDEPQSKPALTVPSLEIRPSERIAVLGRIGSGKSTLLRLLAGMAAPTHGHILLDETPLDLTDNADVRRDVGVVMQDSSLFYGSLRDNLLLAQPRASDAEILEAMRLSCADKLLLKQPHGLDLKLRESGRGLSGGQKQALLLARLFLRAPRVLILDEPTTALDEVTEQAIIENLRGWLGSRTLVIATHRYALLALVDRIIIVDDGRIVRDAPKAEILKDLKATPVANARRPT